MCAIEFEPVISTERLRLRRPRKSDADAIARFCNDLDVARMTSRIPHPYGLADAEDYLAGLDHKDPLREATFAIEHPADGLIGMMSFFPDDAGRSEIGYWLGRPYWGQGYATEVTERALVWANRDWGRRYVMAGHFSDNPASGQVLCKAGFLYTGEVKLLPSVARGGEAPARM
jgi:RimJ/RimL family protein N-acetyltransferase